MNKPRYKFYATLLDAYQYYLDSEEDVEKHGEAFQSLIDKINRVPFRSEAAEKGTAFNELVDHIVAGGSFATHEVKGETMIPWTSSKDAEEESFSFRIDVVMWFVDYFRGAASQVRTEALLSTPEWEVLLYGNADEVRMNYCFDIKTTKQYEFPKFTKNYQHKVYPYCFNAEGIFIDRFEYTVTDFKGIFKEEYPYNPEKDVPALQLVCGGLIRFLEDHRHLITDKKVFAEDEN